MKPTDAGVGEFGVALAVAAGGAAGALARYGVVRAAAAALGPNYPYGTLFVNVVGAGAMGFALHWLAARGWPAPIRAFLTVGFLGALTTFSTFAFDATALFRLRGGVAAAAYVAGSVGLAIGAFTLGFAVARRLS